MDSILPYFLRTLVAMVSLAFLGGLIRLPEIRAELIRADLLGVKLKDMADRGLGVTDIQDALDKEQFTAQPVDGQQVLDQISTILSRKFQSAFEAVQEIKEKTEAGFQQKIYRYSNSTEKFNLARCCEVDDRNFEVMDRLGIKADPSTLCYRTSPMAHATYEVVASDQILQTMRGNYLAHRWLKIQYIGTEDGFSLTYPAKHEEGCRRYTPRFSPWYVETATPEPKDIVLVLDKSESMANNNLMDTAKNAALQVLATLNPNDRIGLVDFSSDVSTPPGSSATDTCYSNQLAFATPDNKAYLRDYIMSIIPNGGTSYIKALNAAFSFFNVNSASSTDSRPRAKAILFLTDGEPTDATRQTIYGYISDRNSKLNNSVVILTYGIGEEAKTSAADLLMTMASQNFSNRAFGAITRGIYTPVENSNNLREKLGTYYNIFSKYRSDTPIVSVPYVDFFRQELIASVCLPLYDPSTSVLRGVTCVDVSIEDMAADVSYFKQGEYSYAFLIDGTGRTTMHPLLPKPHPGENTSVFVDISALESNVKLKGILADMKRGGNGSDSVHVPFVVPRGNSTTNGADQISLDAHYYWKKLEGTNFSLCIVVSERDKMVTVESQAPPPNHFVYHRLDLVPGEESEDGVAKCEYIDGKLATKEHSTVMFTAAAFKDPAYLTISKEDTQQIQRFKNYFEGNDGAFPTGSPFKDGVKDMVTTTANMDGVLSKESVYTPYLVWRYIGVYNGFLRIYPGRALDQSYDHTTRAWYETSMALRGLLVMSPPYVDAFGAGILTTLSQTIYMGRPDGAHSDTDPVIGVVAMDFTMDYFAKIIGDNYPACKNETYTCFVLDDRGYLVYHQELEDTYKDGNGFRDEHITNTEYDIANDLIKRQDLVKSSCTMFNIKQNMFTWKLKLQSGISKLQSSPAYDMQRVPNSNLYLAIKKKYTSFTSDCICSKPTTYVDLVKCRSRDKLVCECPCYSGATFDYCANMFTVNSDGTPACSPWTWSKDFNSSIPNEAELARLHQRCYPSRCPTRKVAADCQGVVGCQWCLTMESQGTPACVERTKCYTPATEMTPNDPQTTSDATGGSSQGLIIGLACAGVILLLVLAVVLAVIIVRRRVAAKKEKQKDIQISHSHHTYAEIDLMVIMARLEAEKESQERGGKGTELDEGDYLHTAHVKAFSDETNTPTATPDDASDYINRPDLTTTVAATLIEGLDSSALPPPCPHGTHSGVIPHPDGYTNPVPSAKPTTIL